MTHYAGAWKLNMECLEQHCRLTRNIIKYIVWCTLWRPHQWIGTTAVLWPQIQHSWNEKKIYGKFAPPYWELAQLSPTLTFPFQVVLTKQHVIYGINFSSHHDFITPWREGQPAYDGTQRNDKMAAMWSKQGKQTDAHGHARYARKYLLFFYGLPRPLP